MAPLSTPTRAYAVIPHGATTLASTSPRSVKRRISPSGIQSPSKRSLLLVSSSGNPPQAGQRLQIGEYCSSKQLFPNQQAQIIEEQASWHTNNVLVPFDLRDPTVATDEGEIKRMLHNIFPETIGVMESVPRLWFNFYVAQLPSTPWPVTVGGLPITLRTDTQGRGPLFPLRRQGRMNISICEEFNGRAEHYLADDDFRLLVRAVGRHFQTYHPNVRLCEVIMTMQNSIYVVLDGDNLSVNTVAHLLPGKIARCFVGYLHESELHRPARPKDSMAMRDLRPDPFSGVSDNTAYDTLRPGVMVWSDQVLTHAHPITWTTTAGVLVKNNNNQAFMTGASHGFGEAGIIYQPQPGNTKRIIGQAVQEINLTDIALVQLRDSVDFVNITFEDDNGNVPNFTRLFGEHPDDLLPKSKFPEMVFLNSPFSGIMEGTVVAKSLAIASKYPAEEEIHFIPYEWAYTGQIEDAGESPRAPPNGVCGSAIWDDKGVVTGFFQYHISKGMFAGFYASVAASKLVKAGFKLALYS
ncbi:hypothetical protein CDD83_3468 [Cordyceps sp. RAO-2017]|nr:hypothetical protein CDD83_3468 [Cordyceps sp. RAO-2017]